MRRFLLTIFTLFLTFVSAHAAPDTMECLHDIVDGKKQCGEGCYLNTNGNICEGCSAGFYCAENTKTQCPRNWPSSTEWASTIQNCFKTCTPQEIALGTIGKDKAYYDEECDTTTVTCVSNAYWSNSQCVCKPGFSATPGKTACEADLVTITLDANGGQFETTKTIYAKCGKGFASSKDSGTWQTQPPIEVSSWWGQTFEGYYTSATGGEQKISANGTLSNTEGCPFTEDITLYAHWKQNPYKITYNHNPGTSTQNCNLGEKCEAQKATNPTSGQTLQYWKCTSGCTGNLQPGDIIPAPDATQTTDTPNIQLTAVWIDCEAGYYCPNGQKKPCPDGSTSDGGAGSINGCYIGKNKIVFKNADGSTFTLPNTYYLIK